MPTTLSGTRTQASVQFWDTYTLLEYFRFIQPYTSDPLHFRGKYRSFYSTLCLTAVVTSYFSD